MKKILYLASKNPGKIIEYQKMLGDINCQLLLQPSHINVIEDGDNFKDNAKKKACEISKKTKNFAIADDSGLCIDALNGRPGIFSSRFASTDQKRIDRVLKELKDKNIRSAFFVANVCLSSPEGKVIVDVEDRCYGNILFNRRGIGGFGYDPIFEESSTNLTFAEMDKDLKDKLSHRGKALEKIIPYLISIFN
tara:strand:- start:890 stop:1468 length:579 start_codon:yes stop_codon:yes gene_type:complete